MPEPKKKKVKYYAHLFYADCMNYERSFVSFVSQADANKLAQAHVANGDSDQGEGEYVILTGTGISFQGQEPRSVYLEVTDVSECDLSIYDF